MANVYVEARPKGHPEVSHIVDYVVEDHSDRRGKAPRSPSASRTRQLLERQKEPGSLALGVVTAEAFTSASVRDPQVCRRLRIADFDQAFARSEL